MAALSAQGTSDPLLKTASLIGLGVLAAVLGGVVVVHAQRAAGAAASATGRAHPHPAGAAGAPRAVPPKSARRSSTFRQEAVGLLARRWWVITLAQLAGHLSVYLVLLVSLRAVGVDSAR